MERWGKKVPSDTPSHCYLSLGRLHAPYSPHLPLPVFGHPAFTHLQHAKLFPPQGSVFVAPSTWHVLSPGLTQPSQQSCVTANILSSEAFPDHRTGSTTSTPRCQYPFIPYGFTFFMYHRTENYLKLFQCFCILFTCSGIFFLKLHQSKNFVCLVHSTNHRTQNETWHICMCSINIVK